VRGSGSERTRQAETGADHEELHNRHVDKRHEREQIPMAEILSLYGARLRKPRNRLPHRETGQSAKSRRGDGNSQTPNPLSGQTQGRNDGWWTEQREPKPVASQQHGERWTTSPDSADVRAERGGRKILQLERSREAGGPKHAC
jgi:hypothetical protein